MGLQRIVTERQIDRADWWSVPCGVAECTVRIGGVYRAEWRDVPCELAEFTVRSGGMYRADWRSVPCGVAECTVRIAECTVRSGGMYRADCGVAECTVRIAECTVRAAYLSVNSSVTGSICSVSVAWFARPSSSSSLEVRRWLETVCRV